MADLYLLSADQWAVLEPFMPENQPGARRVDELPQFEKLIDRACHVGEIGLDGALVFKRHWQAALASGTGKRHWEDRLYLARYCVTQASAMAKAAEDRAHASEALARSLAQQRHETTESRQEPGRRLQRADGRVDERQVWLKRLRDSIHSEFHSLTRG